MKNILNILSRTIVFRFINNLWFKYLKGPREAKAELIKQKRLKIELEINRKAWFIEHGVDFDKTIDLMTTKDYVNNPKLEYNNDILLEGRKHCNRITNKSPRLVDPEAIVLHNDNLDNPNLIDMSLLLTIDNLKIRTSLDEQEMNKRC